MVGVLIFTQLTSDIQETRSASGTTGSTRPLRSRVDAVCELNMIKRIITKYRKEGLYGIHKAMRRRLDLRRQPIIHPVQVALDEVCSENNFTIVQIGAYIGNTSNDPLFQTVSKRLHNTNGRLICVEPIKEYYDQLVENYRGVPNVIFENVAIADHNGLSSFYRLGVDPVKYGFPDWLSQLGSLKKERMLSIWNKCEANGRLQAFYLQHRIEEKVQCITFAELIQRHHLLRVDLLQIDVEGYELEILKTIDFSIIPIRFVNYECVLLHENRRLANRLMQKNGYRLVDYGQDTFAYKNEDNNLKKRWTRT